MGDDVSDEDEGTTSPLAAESGVRNCFSTFSASSCYTRATSCYTQATVVAPEQPLLHPSKVTTN
eukprot:scaffold549_cov72-Phaeocystis_antarctica.AAC.7